MSTAQIKEKMTYLSSSNPDVKEVTDQDVSDVASMLKFGNRLRIELRDKLKKHGIHHLKSFASKHLLPEVELDGLKMNPTIEVILPVRNIVF